MVGFSDGRASPLPFPAIVGQEPLKRALLAVSVNDAIDGLLIRGEKGTAKSTAVRALVDLLPTQRAVADCPYACPPDRPAAQCESCRNRGDPPVEERPVPLVTVPLGATRERIVGSLSVSDALDGEAKFEPGLLARANRGFLYVDEVNLLDDHLVDVLLDAAASGVNRVERDGMSLTHPADFTLLGTMNPEEGDLRPQLRDRFAIQATVSGSDNPDERVAIIDIALEGDGSREPSGPEQRVTVQEKRQMVREARDRIDEVTVPGEFKERIATVCANAGVDGHRGDIAAARTALSFAALDGRDQVIQTDVREALELALPHRLRSRPFEDGTDLTEILEDHFTGDDPASDSPEADGDSDSGDDPEAEGSTQDGSMDERDGQSGANSGDQVTGPTADGEDSRPDSPDSRDGQSGDHPGDKDGTETGQLSKAEESPAEMDTGARTQDSTDRGPEDGTGSDESGTTRDADEESESVRPTSPAHRMAPVGEGSAPDIDVEEADRFEVSSSIETGRVQTDPSPDAVGPRVRTEPAESPEQVDAVASVREAAKNGRREVGTRHLRQSVNAGTATALVVFAVDASASMQPAIQAAKGTVMELLKEAYQERDEVAFVAFGGDDAEVLLPPTGSVTLAARHLKELPTGDRTPLPAGLDTVRAVIDRADPAASVAVVVTDGRTNVADGSPTRETRRSAAALGRIADQVLVVDVDQSTDAVGLTDEIVEETEGRRIPLEALSTESVNAEMERAWD